MLQIQKRSLVSCQWNGVKSTTRSFGSTARLPGPGPIWQTMKEGKNERKETPLASNQEGSGFISSLFPFSIFSFFSSPATPPAGRCNLLSFTPCQRMTSPWQPKSQGWIPEVVSSLLPLELYPKWTEMIQLGLVQRFRLHLFERIRTRGTEIKDTQKEWYL